jgi:predicted Rossmann-fold nucleotide-binding protein
MTHPMAPRFDLPFQPIRGELYTSAELMRGFDPIRPESYTETTDFHIYRYFVAHGATASSDPYAGMMEALHDNYILRAMTEFVHTGSKPAVAIMGGHDESRASATYADVARIARLLTQKGFLVSSGGGPGAMEATHLGALLAGAPESEFAAALARLATVPRLPGGPPVIDGDTGQVDDDVSRRLHDWVRPAFELATEYGDGGVSLGVPTWYYGHEPLSPLATNVAKYFQNSIREDILLLLAANGIIYTPGMSGTLQEIFQNAAQNVQRCRDYAPMIFFDTRYWTDVLPVIPLLRALFVETSELSSAPALSEAEFNRFVMTADTVDEAVAKLLREEPTKDKTVERARTLGFGRLLATLPDD